MTLASVRKLPTSSIAVIARKRSLLSSSSSSPSIHHFPLPLRKYFSTGSKTIDPENNKSNDQNHSHVDVAIVGGGAAGSLMAKLLSDQVPSLQVSLLDFRTPKLGKDVLITNNNQVEPNARAYALSPNSLNLLGKDVMHRLCDSGRVAFYDSMQIWESDGPAILHFTKEDLEAVSAEAVVSLENSDKTNDVLGAVIEDEPLVSCLWDELREKDQVDLISPSAVKKIIPSSSSSTHVCDPIELMYETKNKNGEEEEHTLTADLLIAADGANSIVRRLIGAGTFPTISIGYGRKAVTCTVELDSSINKVAFQRFQPNGPIALLPVWDIDNTNKSTAKHYANIVWSTTPTEAEELQNISEPEFINRMNELLQCGPINTPPLFTDETKQATPWPISQAMEGIDLLSKSVNAGLSMSSWTERQRGFVVPPVITEVVGRRFGFDLNLMHAKNYVGTRVCLIGDAAHTIHPMAGQGLNLGMADAECLTRHIRRSVQSGMGIKDKAGLQYALQQYESERQREVVSVMGGIQFLHAVFGTTFSPAIHVRSVGMNVVNSLGPLRRKLVKVATGIDGIFDKNNY